MTVKINKFWQNMLNQGVRPDDGFDTSKRIRVLNGLSMVAVAFTFFNALWGIILDIIWLVLINYAVAIVMLLIIYSNKHGRYKLAQFLFFGIAAIHIGIVEIIFDVGAYFYIFPVFILAAFVVNSKRILFGYFALLLIIFLVSQLKIFPEIVIEIDPKIGSIIHLCDGLFAAILSMFTVNLFRQQYDDNRNIIMGQNKLLKETAKVSNERAEYATLMLKEMNHRVKNNLQLISSLLNIHATQLIDKAAKEAVLNAKQRISSIALIHRQLYRDSHTTTVDVVEYINDLIPFIKESLLANHDEVAIKVDAQKFNLAIEDAVSIGLIINETLTNSIRHGIKDEETKEISLEVKSPDKNLIRIVVIDSGKGIQRMIAKENDGFGYELIKTLASNYDGKVMVDNTSNMITIELFYKTYELFTVNQNTIQDEKKGNDR